MRSMTFQSLCKKLENKPSFEETVDSLKTLSDAAALFTGNPVTSAASLFLAALSERNQLMVMGKSVLDKILNQPQKDYIGRVEQMQEAYGMICFTAFFDELDNLLSKDIRSNLQLSPQEQQRLYQGSLYDIDAGQQTAIVCPTLLHGRAEQDKWLAKLYTVMSSQMEKFVKGLSFWKTAHEWDIRSFEMTIHKLPTAAINRFHDQYLYLCGNFYEFFAFVQLEREEYQEMRWNEQYRTIISITQNLQDSTQVGMAALSQALQSSIRNAKELQEQAKKESVREISDELISTYHRAIERPLIDTTDNTERLIYPPISQAFIPQAYKLLEYSGKEQLEPPETWKALEPRQDMESFWAKYFLDPSSTNRLLLVLGEPGGGKSLLTKVLCARMISPTDMFIRVPFREHDIEDGIERIICRQIEKDGDAANEIQKFKWFAEEFSDSPITLLFDGYDEVLQTTGGVYRSLLKELRKFQDRCQEFRRPVRIVVTSRATLIDKAHIPEETIVMRLLEFNEQQENLWIGIWNQYNHSTLSEAGIRDFALPIGSKDICQLSKQPLLLLMLAIYDADFEEGINALSQKAHRPNGLDRMGLYDELLRRFIRRELRKDDENWKIRKHDQISFEELSTQEQSELTDKEMYRLGTAALGMLARGKLYIRADELDTDLSYMGVMKSTGKPTGIQPLKDAESLFGSFFFIHVSCVGRNGKAPQTAYEFLHKTFYEFLIADLTLRCLMEVAERLYQAGKNVTLDACSNSLKEFPKTYYAVLCSAFLCTEPEIIRMMTEWAERKRNRCFSGDHAAFCQLMKHILVQHIAMLRKNTFALPGESIGWLLEGQPRFAAYFMNLLTLQALTMNRVLIEPDDWRYLSQFVRLNGQSARMEEEDKQSVILSEELILKFMTLFQVYQEGNTIVLQKRESFQDIEQRSYMTTHMDLVDFMQDSAPKKFYMLHAAGSPDDIKEKCRQELYEQGFDDFAFEINITQLKKAILNPHIQSIPMEILESGIAHLQDVTEGPASVLEWLMCLSQLANKAVSAIQPVPRRCKGPNKSARHQNTGHFLVWNMLGKIIFSKYICQKELVLTYITLLIKVDYQDIFLDCEYINALLDHQPGALPELVEAILSVVSRGLYDNEEYPIVTRVEERLTSLVKISSKAVAALLRYLHLSGQLLDTDPIWDKLEQEWPFCLQTSPSGFSDLLQVYLQAGKVEAVRSFFQHTVISSRDMETLLDIAQTVCEDTTLCVKMSDKIALDPELAKQYPRIFFRLIYYASSDIPVQIDKRFFIRFFLQTYRQSFGIYPVEAAQLLFRISSRFPQDNARINEAYITSLKEFHIILDCSVGTAIQLITMLERMDKKEQQSILKCNPAVLQDGTPTDCNTRLSYYIQHCFHSALISHDESCIGLFFRLLDEMDDSLKKMMTNYFQNQLYYIRAYSEELSDKVKCVLLNTSPDMDDHPI